jgi:hypothetical protein
MPRRPVDPDAMKNDGDLARDRDFRLPPANPFDQPHAPRLQDRPLLGSMNKGGGRLEQIGP